MSTYVINNILLSYLIFSTTTSHYNSHIVILWLYCPHVARRRVYMRYWHRLWYKTKIPRQLAVILLIYLSRIMTGMIKGWFFADPRSRRLGIDEWLRRPSWVIRLWSVYVAEWWRHEKRRQDQRTLTPLIGYRQNCRPNGRGRDTWHCTTMHHRVKNARYFQPKYFLTYRELNIVYTQHRDTPSG